MAEVSAVAEKLDALQVSEDSIISPVVKALSGDGLRRVLERVGGGANGGCGATPNCF